MWQAVLSVLICGALFALYGWVQQRGCNGHCAGCIGAHCARDERIEHHE
jgi:hypothetical protein